MSIHGKIALIPGASRPVGRAIARKFGEQGAALVLPVYDWPESIAEMENEFNQANFQYYAARCDLRQEKEVAQLASDVQRRFAALDFLINNIERGGMPIVHGSYDLPHNSGQWNLEIETTLNAKWLLYHNFYQIMKGRQGGAVVNISSVASITGRSGPGAVFFSDGYSAANRGIQSFTENWAREAAPTLRVNELMLGLIQHRHGEGTRGWENLSDNQRKDLHASILLQRTGTPEEVADAVYYLAVEAKYVTGAVLRMDGGFTLASNRAEALPPGILE